MHGNTRKLIPLGAICLFVFQPFICTLAAQDTGRPKILVLPFETAVDRKVAETFQWDLAKTLDRSGNFDIVSEKQYNGYLKAVKLDREPTIPDSIVPRMMDSLNVSIFTKGTLSQPGGKGTELNAKVDFIYPKNEFTIEGDEYSVSDEKMTEDLAKKVSQKIILASEKISYMSIARDYYNSSIYRKAIEYYEKFLQLEPNSINALYLIATSYLKMDSVDVAIQRYEEILANIDPDHIPTRDILAKTYFGRENYEKALEHYKILAEKKPEVYEYTQYEAYCLIKLERNEEALAAFRRLIKIRDDDPGIRTQMGFLRYTKANELEQSGDSAAAREQALNAVGHFHRSVELYRRSTDPEEIIRKFSASGQQEDLEQVKSAGQKVRAALENLEMDQEKLSAAKQELELALKDMDLRKIEEAGQKIKAALGDLEGIQLKMDPAEEKRMLDALNLAALADIKAGNNGKALEDFKKLVEIDPAYPNAYYYMAVKANELNRFDEALRYCQEALKYVPENMHYSLYSIMGRIYYREKKDFSKAVDAYTRALPLAPADRKVIVLLFRGLSYYDMAQQTDYSNDENVDMDLLIDEEKMTPQRADQALVYYDKALDDLGKVSGRYAKSAQAHINNIAQLKKRLDKIKQQIAYYQKTK